MLAWTRSGSLPRASVKPGGHTTDCCAERTCGHQESGVQQVACHEFAPGRKLHDCTDGCAAHPKIGNRHFNHFGIPVSGSTNRIRRCLICPWLVVSNARRLAIPLQGASDGRDGPAQGQVQRRAPVWRTRTDHHRARAQCLNLDLATFVHAATGSVHIGQSDPGIRHHRAQPPQCKTDAFNRPVAHGLAIGNTRPEYNLHGGTFRFSGRSTEGRGAASRFTSAET